MKKQILAIIMLSILALKGYCADSKVTSLPAATSIGLTDITMIITDVSTSPTNKKITFDNLQLSINKVGTITSGTWNASAIDDAYITSSSLWNNKVGSSALSTFELTSTLLSRGYATTSYVDSALNTFETTASLLGRNYISNAGTSTDNALMVWDGATGKIAKDGTIKQNSIGTIRDVNAIVYNTNPTQTTEISSTYWDTTNHTLSTALENGVVLQHGQELHVYGKNTSGVVIHNGDAVSVVANNGSFTAFGLTDATSAQSAYAFVGLATQDIDINAFGYVTKGGVVRDLNTDSYIEGRPVYVDPTSAGHLTQTYPSAPNYIINAGIVEYKQTNNGRINVFPLVVGKLQDLSDVNGTTLETTGQIPVWNNTNKYFDFNYNIVNYATLSNLSTFETTQSLLNRNYITASPLATFELASHASSTYATLNNLSTFETTQSLLSRNYITSSALSPYATLTTLSTYDTISARQTAFNNYYGLVQDPTGFVTPENVNIVYDVANRKIILSGEVTAYYRGNQLTEIVNGWSSEAHPATNGAWFLSYNGSAFTWESTVWSLDRLQIAAVNYGANNKFAFRESHGFMPWQTHKELHLTIGCYRMSGGSTSNVTTGSTTATNRRPSVEATVIADEDLMTTLPVLQTGAYTQMWLDSTGTNTFSLGTAEIIPQIGNQARYNLFSGSTWSQATLGNNSYTSVWLVAIPASYSSTSQSYRYLWIQGQSAGTLASQQGLTPSSVNLNGFSSYATEFVFLAQFIIHGTTTNWDIQSVVNLTGNRIIQTSTPAGSYLSSVATDTSMTGDGTVGNPLSIASVLVSDATNNNTFVGANAGANRATGATFNTFVGTDAGKLAAGSTSAVSGNVGLGADSLFSLTKGAYNMGIGCYAQYYQTTGNRNTSIGHISLVNNIAGDANIAIGYAAGAYATATNEVYINSIDRGTTAAEKTDSIIYGVQNSSASSQTMAINAALTATYGVNVPAGQSYKIGGTNIFSTMTKEMYVQVIAPTTTLTVASAQAQAVITQGLAGKTLLSIKNHVYIASTSGTPEFQVRNITRGTTLLSRTSKIDVNTFDSNFSVTTEAITAGLTFTTGDALALDCVTAGTGTKGWDCILRFQ